MRRATRANRAAFAAFLAVAVLMAAGCQLVEKSTRRPVKRVVVVGDSVMNWDVPYLQQQYGAWGAQVRYVGGLSTGPLSYQKRWASDLRAMLATFPADLVIFEACCHYEGTTDGVPGPLYVNSGGATVQPDTELMYTELAAADAELIQIVRDAGASPYWVKLPPGNANSAFYGPTFPTRIDRFNQIVDTLGVPIIDWGTLVMSQPNVDALRYPDGIHYLDAGYLFVAKATYAATVALVP